MVGQTLCVKLMITYSAGGLWGYLLLPYAIDLMNHISFVADDEYLHLHKEELARSAVLLGAGIIKGVILTGIINNSDNGVTIGKKK